jgi:DMSO/TMAO reductase YedYZ molybdopterin-dependent catalytic subunit
VAGVAEAVLQTEELLLGKEPPNAEAGRLNQLITGAADRFVRSHYPVPLLGASHSLEIGGAVVEARRLGLRDLRALEPVTLTVTTECAGNWRTTLHPPTPGEQWNRGAISTAQWTGIPLRSLVQLRETAVELVFTGADGGEFQRSLPREAALDPSVLVAWEMNGEPIPPLFGGPLRLVVPGWYGMASVKWLARIEAVEKPFGGKYQTAKYVYAPGDPVTRMRPKAMFSEVPQIVRAGSPAVITGFAWSGTGIERVQVAIDGSFREARLVGPALPHAWRRFELRFTPPRPGKYSLRCRAFDASGEGQPEEPVWNELGYGANGIQELQIDAR